MATFVMEIGSEELPSRFLPGEEAYLKQGFEAKLAESGLEFQSVSVYSTPRRAVVAVPTRNHEKYMQKMGFAKEGEVWVKTLG